MDYLQNNWFLILLIIWTMPWKGVALWKAAKNKHKKWFIVLFVLNTAALLDIAYIFYFSEPKKLPKKKKEKSANNRHVP